MAAEEGKADAQLFQLLSGLLQQVYTNTLSFPIYVALLFHPIFPDLLYLFPLISAITIMMRNISSGCGRRCFIFCFLEIYDLGVVCGLLGA